MLMKKIKWGIVSGITAGIIMGAAGFILHILGLMPESGIVINASMILPPDLMDTALIYPAGMMVHMLFSAFFALVFLILTSLFNYQKLLLWGII